MIKIQAEINEKEMKWEIKKNSRNKWQWKHNNANLLDATKAILRGKFILI